MRRLWIYLTLVCFIIILDQLTKGWIQSSMQYGEQIPVIDGFFSITYVRNKGAAFGMGQNFELFARKILFLLIPVLACIWISWLLFKHRNDHIRSGLIYSFILAGAIGNLIDRFSMGHVVDFLLFYWRGHYFPAFNVADSSITIGAILIWIDFLIELKDKKAKKEA